MARKVEEINAFTVAQVVTYFAAAGITINPTQWSQVNLLRALVFSVSVGQATLEQLQDAYQQTIENIAATAPAASPKWVQAKMFLFQYSATDPQIIALVDTVPVYPSLRPDLRIITACSVTSAVSNREVIKVAQGFPFAPLDSSMIAAAQGYINTIGVAGIDYSVVSLDSDKMYITADVFYQGQYAAVIQVNVIAAINAWFVKLAVEDFDGIAEMSDLEATIRNVTGVNDVVLKNVRGRADTDTFDDGIDLILGTAIIYRRWQTIAGYIGQETTTGKTFADSLNFVIE